MNSIPGIDALADPLATLLGAWSVQLNAWSILFRTLVALLLSAVIGWERSTKRHSAGLRTFMLVSLVGTLAAMLDCYVHLMTGSGFFILSAGTIIGAATISIHSVFYSSRNQIKGLTTAVGLWAAGLIGMAVGMGLYTLALISFVALLVALLWFPPLELAFKNHSNHFEVHLELNSSVSLQDFVTVIRRLGLSIDEIEQNPAYVGSGLAVYSIAISVSNEMLKKYKTHKEIIEALRTLDFVYYIEEMHN